MLADIHGDIFALDAALGRLREMGCDPILCTGDLIEMEPFGEEVIQRLKSEKNVICIKGNHERWALERRRRRKDVRSFFEPCSIADYIGGGIELSREALAWLATLPAHWEGELEGMRVAMWHARPGSDMEGIEKERTGPELRRHLLEQARAQVLIVGHTHLEFELVVNVPARKNTEPRSLLRESLHLQAGRSAHRARRVRPATFGVLELPSMRFEVYRALDGERVFGTSPDRPCFRPPRRTGG